MSFRYWKAGNLPVVRICGVPYVLDVDQRQLRAVHDPEDCIELEDVLR